MNKIYDISFIIPMCDINKHYFNIFTNARKHCLLNIKKRQVRVKLLIGPGETFYNEDITAGWPENVTVEVINTPYSSAPQKIAYYYTQLTDDEISSAKWHAKIDDDTFNNIESLMKNLEEEFNHDDKNYLVTTLAPELEDVERDILSKMGFSHFTHHEKIRHEWEGCFVSHAAMQEIKDNKNSQIYLKHRMLDSRDYGDQIVAIALKFCKISAIKGAFLSQFSNLKDFSLFGGHHAHIHFFANRGIDQLNCFEFANSIIECTKENQEIKNKIVNCNYACNANDNFEETGTLFFKENNKLIWENKNNEKKHGLWSVYKNKILAIAFDENDEHSIVYELFQTDEQKFTCHRNKMYSIDGFVKMKMTKFL